ncbi:MAG: glycerophosphoryl diester phosphodiesterase [Alphaproteobacteria bacterium]|nr:glycerophosphoryl diester phosphodiesterase [Alphaproteobacteria bacterium]
MKLYFKFALGALLGLALFAFLNNTSWLAPIPETKPLLLAHRGMAQTFSHAGLGRNDCTATLMDPPTHPYLENTIASMAESFRLGADIAEIDIHPTTEGQFVVFHDWTLDCRTDGHGVTREHSLAELKRVDIGYGYTADGGKTFPFRDKGVGQMPSLDEVFAAFPDKGLLINVKGNSTAEGEQLAARLAKLPPERRKLLMIYGSAGRPTAAMRTRLPDVRAMDKPQLKNCAMRYAALGWSGYVPRSCRNTIIVVPINYTWLIWGWPNRFLARMQAAGSLVFVAGPYHSNEEVGGINTEEQFRALPQDYRGGIWTDEIEVIAPLLRGPVSARNNNVMPGLVRASTSNRTFRQRRGWPEQVRP